MEITKINFQATSAGDVWMEGLIRDARYESDNLQGFFTQAAQYHLASEALPQLEALRDELTGELAKINIRLAEIDPLIEKDSRGDSVSLQRERDKLASQYPGTRTILDRVEKAIRFAKSITPPKPLPTWFVEYLGESLSQKVPA